MKLPENVSEAVRKRNPALFGPMGAVGVSKREPNTQPALEQDAQAQPKSKRSVAIVVSIVTLRRRILDSDNSIAGNKGLRDAIARGFGVDDADPRVRWEYGQVQTTGPEGTIVRLSLATKL